MKLFLKFAFPIALLAISVTSAFANVPTISANTTFNLATDTTGTSLVSLTGSGTLHAISCKVTTAVTGIPEWTMTISVDGGTATYVPAIYFGAGFGAPFNDIATGTGGLSVGDHFTLPMHVTYTTSLSVASFVLYNATAGALSCAAIYN
jgi:hypothetical protein